MSSYLCYFTEKKKWKHIQWRPYQIIGGETVKNVQIDPRTTTDGESESVSDTSPNYFIVDIA